jgi:hypothetical protein
VGRSKSSTKAFANAKENPNAKSFCTTLALCASPSSRSRRKATAYGVLRTFYWGLLPCPQTPKEHFFKACKPHENPPHKPKLTVFKKTENHLQYFELTIVNRDIFFSNENPVEKKKLLTCGCVR